MGNKGLTIFELIIVIVILAIVSTFAVIGVTRYMTETRIKGDTNTVATLNKVTYDYAVLNSSSTSDVFFGFDTDEDRINELIDAGVLSHYPDVLQSGASFVWDVDSQVWTLEGGVLSGYTGSALSYDFSNDLMADITEDGVLFRNPDGWNDDEGYLENDPGEQRAFIPIGKSSYTITTTAALSEGSAGGYGIFFDTILEDGNVNSDTGWILQFDRGYDSGAIIVRPRVSGSERGAVWRLAGRSSDLIPSIQQDADWWAESHTVKITVVKLDGDNKSATFYIDGVNIGTYEYTYVDNDEMVYTGFRTWSSPTTKFYSISVN